MSWLSNVENFFVTTEQDVLKIIVKVKQDIQIADHEINLALAWIADHAPAIAADIEGVLSIVQVAGLANPAVGVAIAAANEAVVALNAYATAYQKGQGTAASVVQGYSAFKQAQAAAASAASVAVSAKPVTVAMAAAVPA
jgi:hypothetical protein